MDLRHTLFPAGGLGIGLGFATYGYKIIRVFGVKMVHLTFARGFAVELGAAIVIVVASKYGLPVSSTQVFFCLLADVCDTACLSATDSWIPFPQILITNG